MLEADVSTFPEAETLVRQKLLNISGSRRYAPTQISASSTD